MSYTLFAFSLIFAAYLFGAIPFGYIIAKLKGVDLFQAGSGNIGATNVGRILGRKFGILVFALDFLKGAVPVAMVPTILRLLPQAESEQLTPVDWLRVGVALAAFLGHLFPIYLKFRGGKGVATGAGTVFVLVPGPSAVALLIWLAVLASSRIVSLASIVAAITLCAARIIFVSSPFTGNAFILTAFCLSAVGIVILKHRANLERLRRGNENHIEARNIMDFLARALHLLALGLWLGGSVFFSFVAAPTIFASFKDVVKSAPSDRTAHVPISIGLDDAKKDELGSALAGSAVGPIFPIFFGLQAICATIALVTALGWWKRLGKVHRWRVYLIGAALATVAIGWPISLKVSELRVARFSDSLPIAEAAKADFATWHLVSLGLSFVTTLLAFIALILAAKLPVGEQTDLSKSR